MRIIQNLSLLVILLIGVKNISAQEAQDTTSKKSYISYTIGTGIFNYRGDIGQVENLGTAENFQIGASLGTEYTFLKTLGIDITGFYGQVSKNERNESVNSNFKTTLIGLSLKGTFHFANGFILSENCAIDPFISSGLTFIKFDPRTDSLDVNGDAYYYWRDGSIRDLRDEANNVDLAKQLDRDYEYETQIKAGNEELFSLSIPVAVGFNFRINNYLSAQIKQTIHLTMSDFIDGKVGGVTNDLISFTNLGFVYTPSGNSRNEKSKEQEYDEIDFNSLLKSDSDSDGILDIDDWCQETDLDIEVDKHGCPIDKDSDGISDYKDKEIDTEDTALKIDSNGISISDSLVALEALDTIVTLREELCLYYPSMCQGDETDIEFQLLNRGKADKSLLNSKVKISNRPIEEITKEADINKNGKISSKEIYETIDLYFDGKLTLSLGDIHKLIDYFFEQ